jgi:prepilin-type N-terminal cleavage/methylation domain-containing protein
MSSKLTRRRRLLKLLSRDESGFSLIELLMVSAILPIVLSAILGAFDSVGGQAPKNIEYTHAVTEAQVGLQRMIQEIGEATSIGVQTPSEIEFNAVIGGTGQEIHYACSTQCLRYSVTSGGALPTLVNNACPTSLTAAQTCQVVVARVTNGNSVFSYSNPTNDANAPPTWVRVQIQVPAKGERTSGLNHTITLDNATAVRNLLLL